MNKNNIISCPSCASKKIVRTGKNKNQIIQRHLCKKCLKTFSLNPIKNKTYPIKIILNAISYYHIGYTQEEVIKLINKKHKIKVPQKTISNWFNQYKPICAFARIRNRAIKNYGPREIIKKQTLNHIQPYTFKHHQAKLNLLTEENPKFAKLKDYIQKINSKEFPHHIFTYNKGQNKNSQRASQIKFNHLKITKIKCSKIPNEFLAHRNLQGRFLAKQNLANKLAVLALNLAKPNKNRPKAIQDFFLANDSATIAAEMPVYFTNWDAGYYRNQRNFSFSLSDYQTPITGHINLLQIRNNLIHIMDYKTRRKYKPRADNPAANSVCLGLVQKTKFRVKAFQSCLVP